MRSRRCFRRDLRVDVLVGRLLTDDYVDPSGVSEEELALSYQLNRPSVELNESRADLEPRSDRRASPTSAAPPTQRDLPANPD